MSLSINSYNMFFSVKNFPDAEWKRIIDRLWYKYGIRSSGSKSADENKLHELELKEAETDKESSLSEFLTITQNELEKIKDKNKETDIKNNPKEFIERQGAQILGEQIYLAIILKNEKDFVYKKKKTDNKYFI